MNMIRLSKNAFQLQLKAQHKEDGAFKDIVKVLQNWQKILFLCLMYVSVLQLIFYFKGKFFFFHYSNKLLNPILFGRSLETEE